MLLAVLTLALGVVLVNPMHVSAQDDPEWVAFDHDLTVQESDTVQGDVSVTNGNLTIYGTVDGKATVVNGKAFVYGKVLGDVAVLTGGGVTLFPKSSVGGNVVASGEVVLSEGSVVNGSVTALGGKVTQDSGAVVNGSINTMQNPADAIQNLVQPGDHSGGISSSAFYNSPFGRITGLFTIGLLSVLILLVSVGMAAVIPNRVRIASATLQAEPGPSIVMGIITAFLILPVAGVVAAVLAISVIGIVLLPVLAVVLLGAFLLGFVVVCHWLGNHLHETTRQNGSNGLPHQAPLLIIEVLLGVAIVLASTLMPVLFLPAWVSLLMFLLVYTIACIGIGATILSRLGTLAPPKHRHSHKIVYPTVAHSHYGSSLVHSHPGPGAQLPVGVGAERTNTIPLGPPPILPRDE